MLTSIPTAINISARLTTLRNPNSLKVTRLERQILRKELDSFGNPVIDGGAPTMGGMGMLRSEDEAEFEYIESAQPGRLMILGGVTAPADLNDSGAVQLSARAVTARIECEADPLADGYWTAEKGDLFVADLGMGVLLTYEAVTLSTNVLIPPYTRTLILNPRDDLSYV